MMCARAASNRFDPISISVSDLCKCCCRESHATQWRNPFSVQNRFLDGIFRQCFRSTECESIKRKPQISVSANTISVARRVIFEFHFCLRTESRDGKKGEEKKRFAEWSLGSGHCVRYTWCTNKINDFRFLEHFSAGSERTEQRYTKANYKIHNSICWM